MGATEGVEPSEEERNREVDKVQNYKKELPKKFSKLFSSIDQDAIDQGLAYQDALQDILSPPSAPDMNNQVVREGFRLSPEVAPTHVILLAESIPSWLPVVDGWGSEHIFLHCEREKFWYRSNLDLATPLSLFVTVAGIAKAEWINQPNKVVIIQGSAPFCRKIVCGLASIGITEETKIIVTSNEKCRNLKLSFKFLRLSHSNLGGATNTITSIGFSKACEVAENPSFSKGIPATVMDHICPMGTGHTVDPSHDFVSDTEGNTKLLDVAAIHPIRAIASESFVTPSLFSHTNWVTRILSNSEILSILDSPVQITKRLKKEDLDIHMSEIVDTLEHVAPVKVLQEATRILFNWDPPVERAHTIPVYDVNRLGMELEGLEDIYYEINQSQVAKNDDAAANTDLWDEAALTPPCDLGDEIEFILRGKDRIQKVQALDYLRSKQLKRYRTNVRRSFTKYMKTKYSPNAFQKDCQCVDYEFKRDLKEGRQAVEKAADSSFWEWNNGSFPYFWRWQPEIKRDLRDGTSLWVYNSKLPSNTKPQRIPRDRGVFDLMVEKIVKVHKRNYIGKWGKILNLSHYFPVPKGEDDIRIVYDLSASGLNDALWAPRFWMPTMANIVDCAVHTSWFGDVDAAEMFLNFPLDIQMRKYCGVDISWSSEDGSKVWACWHRMAMGMRPSPWVTIRLLMWMMEVVVGDRKAVSNPFRWDSVKLNLPGSSSYDPSLPRVYKWNEISNALACECKFFCDDFRVVGPTPLLTKAATHKLETTMAYLGIQDATRKRRRISQTPGEWTGSIVLSVKDIGVFVTVSQKKWDRARSIVTDWFDQLVMSDSNELPLLDYKSLESDIGFLIHLSMSYPNIKPFLRGFYLTLNSWRRGRDREGWKVPDKAYKLFLALGRRTNGGGDMDDIDVTASNEDADAPTKVRAQPLMREHVAVLRDMFVSTEPVLRLVRGSAIFEALYIFGDASGLGFGSSWISGKDIKYRFGVWGLESKETTSNYRELRNLVETLERSGLDGELKGKEIFVFTDNSTAESIAAKGSSTSPLLFELVTRLYKLSMKFLCSVNIVHVAGTRMIAQGTDGLSRGDLLEGVLKGQRMLSFIPLHLSALEREPSLKDWITMWAGSGRKEKIEFLNPEDWFWRGHDIIGYRKNCDDRIIPSYKKGIYVWSPPPAAARQALEELRQARHKRQLSTHIFLVPHLMSPEWKSQLYKTADLVFTLPFGDFYWPSGNHESLTFGVCFPYLRREPWELKSTPLMGRMAGQLHEVLSSNPSAGRHILSQLFELTTKLDKVSLRQLRKLLSGRWRFTLPHQSPS